MPTSRPKQRAKNNQREGKAHATEAGAFVKEEIQALTRGNETSPLVNRLLLSG